MTATTYLCRLSLVLSVLVFFVELLCDGRAVRLCQTAARALLGLHTAPEPLHQVQALLEGPKRQNRHDLRRHKQAGGGKGVRTSSGFALRLSESPLSQSACPGAETVLCARARLDSKSPASSLARSLHRHPSHPPPHTSTLGLILVKTRAYHIIPSLALAHGLALQLRIRPSHTHTHGCTLAVETMRCSSEWSEALHDAPAPPSAPRWAAPQRRGP